MRPGLHVGTENPVGAENLSAQLKRPSGARR